MLSLPSGDPAATDVPRVTAPWAVLASKHFPFRTEVLPTWPTGTESLYADVTRGVHMINPSDPTVYRSSQDNDWSEWIDQIWEWTNHLDERIDLAIANTRSFATMSGVLEFIAERALATARRERAIWTPVLDALLVRSLTDGSIIPGRIVPRDPWRRALWRQFTKMATWVRAAPHYRASLSLLAYPSYAVHEMVLQNARDLPAEWIAYSANQHPMLLHDRQAIAALTVETVKAVFELTLARAQRSEGNEYYNAVYSLDTLKCYHLMSIKDCSDLERILVKGSGANTTLGDKTTDSLRRGMTVALTAASRSAHVRHEELLWLLQSPCDEVRLATQEFVSEMQSQPT
jgi:hypothetical protein